LLLTIDSDRDQRVNTTRLDRVRSHNEVTVTIVSATIAMTIAVRVHRVIPMTHAPETGTIN